MLNILKPLLLFVEVVRFIHDNFFDKLHIVAYSCFVHLLKLNLNVRLLCYIYSIHCCCFIEVVRFIILSFYHFIIYHFIDKLNKVS